tara:strand:- start:263 stop:475 length:213 start_codon:yes stop_codon:yes gene_type:complete
MIDSLILEECKRNKEILDKKINSLEFAIKRSEEMIAESSISENNLIFLRRKIAESSQDLETLYLIKKRIY